MPAIKSDPANEKNIETQFVPVYEADGEANLIGVLASKSASLDGDAINSAAARITSEGIPITIEFLAAYLDDLGFAVKPLPLSPAVII